jgi:putative ABC transport system permease protein
MDLIKHRVRFGLDSISQAIWALKDNRLRTVLSVLGITVGIAAVMAVGTISKSGHYLIFNELETFGLKSVWVFRSNDEKDPNRTVRAGTGIEAADLEAFRDGCCSAVERISPIVNTRQIRLTVRNGNRFSNAQITGVGAEFSSINNDNLTAGRHLKPEDVLRLRTLAVIGPTVAEDLFGAGTNPIGREIRIDGKKFLVIGLLEAKSRDFLASIGSAGGQDANNRILLPYTTLQMQLGSKDIHVLHAKAVDITQADAAVSQITGVLERQHNHRYKYKSTTMAEYIATSNRILQGVSLIGIVAASVSLLVGGMGIMNIISTSVLERTREIGLRKAVGASQHHILLQFLMESVIISATGGVLGLLFGVAASFALAWITGFPLTPSWSMVMVSFIVSIVVGIFSGYYPARRAAMLRPVIALRYE